MTPSLICGVWVRGTQVTDQHGGGDAVFLIRHTGGPDEEVTRCFFLVAVLMGAIFRRSESQQIMICMQSWSGIGS